MIYRWPKQATNTNGTLQEERGRHGKASQSMLGFSDKHTVTHRTAPAIPAVKNLALLVDIGVLSINGPIQAAG
uniref:Transposase n=1 Tax=Steinernema glaseri TaxID=37863 RepID=A0A1I8AAH7_9BILA